MPGQPLSIEITPDEVKRIESALRAANPMLPYRVPFVLLMTIIYGLQVAIGLIFRPHALLTILHIGLFVFWIIVAVCAMRWRPRLRLPLRGSLQASNGGLTGTLDGAPATIGWRDIAFVSQVAGAIVIFRRRRASPVAIPTAGIGDVRALWALLEDRLIAKRGLIRSSPPKTQINNSVC